MAQSIPRLKMMNYYNYFTEIEEHFVRRRGKHLLISPMDWGLISAWKDAGIPLQVAIRGIDIAMDGFFGRRSRTGSKVNSLCYCHDSVMTEYANFQESRVGESSTGTKNQSEPASQEKESDAADERSKAEALEYLSGIIREIETLAAKQQFSAGTLDGISRVLAKLGETIRNLETGARVDSESLERDLGIIDEILIAELGAEVSQEQMADWEKEAKVGLKVYRKRLPREMFERIHHNYIRNKIHQKFGIGELTLFHL
jgi:hypothetical protein